MKTLVNLLGEHLCIVNILLGPITVHYREVLLYINSGTSDVLKHMCDTWVTYMVCCQEGE